MIMIMIVTIIIIIVVAIIIRIAIIITIVVIAFAFLHVMSYSQSVRWSKRPASQCVRRLVKASDVIGQSVRCDWSKRPM